MANVEDIKDAMAKKKLVVGTDRTIKNIKLGKESKVFISKNCPKDVKDDLERYSKISKVEVSMLEMSNEELSIICKKPYSISVLGILGGKQ